jgi:hypothetical protein
MKIQTKLIFTAILVLLSLGAQALPIELSYQGRLTDSGGNAIEGSSVTFKLQIRSQDGTCLIYEEDHTLDMSGSNGIFNLAIGSGTENGFDSGLGLEQIFDNSSEIAGDGCNYTPSDADGRKLRVSFDAGSGSVTLSPDQSMRAVPYAIHAANADNANSIQGTTLDSALSGLGSEDDGKALVWDGENSKWIAGEFASGGGSSTQVGFSVHRNGVAQTGVYGGVFIDWTTEEFDIGGNFFDTTSDQYTPLVSGYYQVACQLTFNSMGDQDYADAKIYKNGSSVARGVTRQSHSATGSMSILTSKLIYMNGSTDYLQCAALTPATEELNGNRTYTYFQAILIKPDTVTTTDVQKLNLKDPTELTLSSGAVTVTQSFHSIDTESDASLDELDTISGGTLGDKLILMPADSSRTVWITDNGNINTPHSRHYPIPSTTGAEFIFDGTKWRLIHCGDFALTGTHTVDIPYPSTGAEIQGAVNEMPRELNGNQLTFQFANGTYTLDGTLSFIGFQNGTLKILGDTTETDATNLHTTQQVVLDASSTSSNALYFKSNTSLTNVYNLKVLFQSSTGKIGVYIAQDSGATNIYYSYIAGDSNSGGGSAIFNYGPATSVQLTNVSNCYYGLRVYYGKIVSRENQSVAPIPRYGMAASTGGTLAKRGTPQPTGETADEAASYGGVIR